MTELGNYMMQYLNHGLDTAFSYKPDDRSKVCAEYNRSQFIRGLDALQARLHAPGDESRAVAEAASHIEHACTFGVIVSGKRLIALGRKTIRQQAFEATELVEQDRVPHRDDDVVFSSHANIPSAMTNAHSIDATKGTREVGTRRATN
jgi:hypothetical protein